MPGRPDGTFSEPDWLGMFLVFVLAIIYSLIFLYEKKRNSKNEYLNSKQNQNNDTPNKKQKLDLSSLNFRNWKWSGIWKFKLAIPCLYFILLLSYLLLILTVARSAWVGVLAVTGLFLMFILTGFLLCLVYPVFYYFSGFFYPVYVIDYLHLSFFN